MAPDHTVLQLLRPARMSATLPRRSATPRTPRLRLAPTQALYYLSPQRIPAVFPLGKPGTYSVTVTNQASVGASSGLVTVTDTLPAGLTLASMSGTGWTCTG